MMNYKAIGALISKKGHFSFFKLGALIRSQGALIKGGHKLLLEKGTLNINSQQLNYSYPL